MDMLVDIDNGLADLIRLKRLQLAGKQDQAVETADKKLLPQGPGVEQIYGTLWQDGGCIAQCEFGPGARPENVYQVYRAWEQVRTK